MEINYTKDETIKLIEEYYRIFEEREVKASITVKKDLVGIYEEEGCVTTICVSEDIEIAGMKKTIKETITEAELKKKFKALFSGYSFDLKSLTMNSGLNSRLEGYGMAEHEVKSAYFRGITINVDKKKEHVYTMMGR